MEQEHTVCGVVIVFIGNDLRGKRARPITVEHVSEVTKRLKGFVIK